jgi:hypothetical protein
VARDLPIVIQPKPGVIWFMDGSTKIWWCRMCGEEYAARDGISVSADINQEFRRLGIIERHNPENPASR